jgi:hypothetical protein
MVRNEPAMSTANVDQGADKTAWPKLTPARAAILGLTAYLLVYLSSSSFPGPPASSSS